LQLSWHQAINNRIFDALEMPTVSQKTNGTNSFNDLKGISFAALDVATTGMRIQRLCENFQTFNRFQQPTVRALLGGGHEKKRLLHKARKQSGEGNCIKDFTK